MTRWQALRVGPRDVVQRRLTANRLAGARAATPREVVHSLLAVHSQDVHPSAWSIGQRTTGATEAGVERARASGQLLRTHVLRTTWHDVCAEDLRWLLRLTGPRVQLQTAGIRREQQLDADVLATARRALEPALAGRALTRAEVGQVLTSAGLSLDSRALGHLLMHLELDAMLCSGPRRGRWQTCVLLDERVPPAPERDHEAAVAELVQRFLAGHGPATVHDLAWWSSLLVRDLRNALAALGSAVRCDHVDDLELWSTGDAPAPADWPGVQLVQGYDEHLGAFPRSKHLSDPHRWTSARTRPYPAVVLQDGMVAGSWARAVGTAGVTVQVSPAPGLDRDGLERAARAYGAFLGLPAAVAVHPSAPAHAGNATASA